MHTVNSYHSCSDRIFAWQRFHKPCVFPLCPAMHRSHYAKHLWRPNRSDCLLFIGQKNIFLSLLSYNLRRSACVKRTVSCRSICGLTACCVLQAAQIVLISLFELNTPEFTMLLGALPKTFQDGATKLLHNHLKNSSNTSSVVRSQFFPVTFSVQNTKINVNVLLWKHKG